MLVMRMLKDDLFSAVRSLRKHPSFAIFALLTLALSIGVTTRGAQCGRCHVATGTGGGRAGRAGGGLDHLSARFSALCVPHIWICRIIGTKANL